MFNETQIVNELAQYGVKDVAFHYDSDSSAISIRVTDQDYRDHRVVEMIVNDILRPMGVQVGSYASNAFYDTDDRKGALFVVYQ